MVDADVLVQEVLQLFVLVVQLTRFVDKLLAGLKEVVVLGERFIEDFPDSEGSVWEDLSHLLPILLSFSCDKVLLFALGKLL